MASRGPVYKSDKTARFEPHDGCSCTPEPTYSRDAPWPAGSERYAEVYADIKSQGLPADEARSAFRSAIESPAPAG